MRTGTAQVRQLHKYVKASTKTLQRIKNDTEERDHQLNVPFLATMLVERANRVPLPAFAAGRLPSLTQTAAYLAPPRGPEISQPDNCSGKQI